MGTRGPFPNQLRASISNANRAQNTMNSTSFLSLKNTPSSLELTSSPMFSKNDDVLRAWHDVQNIPTQPSSQPKVVAQENQNTKPNNPVQAPKPNNPVQTPKPSNPVQVPKPSQPIQPNRAQPQQTPKKPPAQARQPARPQQSAPPRQQMMFNIGAGLLNAAAQVSAGAAQASAAAANQNIPVNRPNPKNQQAQAPILQDVVQQLLSARIQQNRNK